MRDARRFTNAGRSMRITMGCSTYAWVSGHFGERVGGTCRAPLDWRVALGSFWWQHNGLVRSRPLAAFFVHCRPWLPWMQQFCLGQLPTNGHDVGMPTESTRRSQLVLLTVPRCCSKSRLSRGSFVLLNWVVLWLVITLRVMMLSKIFGLLSYSGWWSICESKRVLRHAATVFSNSGLSAVPCMFPTSRCLGILYLLSTFRFLYFLFLGRLGDLESRHQPQIRASEEDLDRPC